MQQRITQNRTIGGLKRFEAIIIHWWNDPSVKATLDGTVEWFLNTRSQVSAHYVVSGDEVVQMVPESDAAWHALQANSYTIGIEVDPNTPGNTYKTVGELVRSIRSRRGNLPLRPHSYYVNTRCPGTINLSKIELYAQGGEMKPYNTGDVANVSVDTGVPENVLRGKQDWNDVYYSTLRPLINDLRNKVVVLTRDEQKLAKRVVELQATNPDPLYVELGEVIKKIVKKEK